MNGNPPDLLTSSTRQLGFNLYGFSNDNFPLLSQVTKKNKVLTSSTRQLGFNLYGFSNDNFPLLSQVTKKNKVVLLVSSAHHCKARGSENSPPKMISFFNVTKGGDNSFDMQCAKMISFFNVTKGGDNSFDMQCA
ncbi:hypothetical protein QE152_g21721 [Popillia japonica]|uniref:Uncharacterized protein n=1 Tax=Popillia japonica TaxID=7064 RepID=A0AAW1KMR6_POPJA